MTFGPFMNFVVGQNGSGKSAVLTALTLCLGAKAAVTNRGGNIKSFIKEGEHNAIIEVHLRNRGEGFKNDTYGDTIIVQRSFNRDGVNSYKTKSKAGRVISTAKKELSDIIDYMSLQVDNPMTILSQDLARQFLSNSSDEDKYKFFMKGVQLDDLYALYQSMKSQQHHIENVLETKAEDIRELREAREVAEKKFKAVKETQDLRNKVERLLRQHAWTQVSEAEKVRKPPGPNGIEAIAKDLEQSRKKRADMEVDLSNASDSIATWDEKVAEALAAVQSSSENSDPLKEKRKELDDKLSAQSEKISRVQHEERTLDQHLRQARSKVEKAQHDIEAERARLAGAGNGEHATLEKRMEDLREEKEKLQTQQEQLDQSHQEKKDALSEAKTKHQQAKESMERKESEFRAAENTLRSLESNRSNNLGAYGNHAPALIRAINNARWKTKTPVGPIGLLVKLRKRDWSSILERQLSRVLNGFIAFSLEDKDQLIGLVREHRCDNNVYYSKPDAFQLQEPAPEYLTVLRALEIEHEEVKKTLVTINNIEQTILVEDRDDAINIMDIRPRNVKFCYALNRGRRGFGFSVKMGQGSGSVDPIVGWAGPSRIATDMEEQIRAATENLNAIRVELEIEKANCRELLKAVNSAQSAIADHIRTRQGLKTDIQRLENNIEELNDKIQAMRPNSNLEDLESKLEAQKETCDRYEQQQSDNQNEKTRLIGIRDDLKAQIDRLKVEINESEGQTRALQTAHSMAVRQREQAVLLNSTLLEKLEGQDGNISALQDKKQTMENMLATLIADASSVGERIEPERGQTLKKIEKELERVNALIERADARMGASADQIAKDFADKTERYQEARHEVSDLEKLHKALDRAFEERMERWYHFRRHISVQSRLQFHFLMSEREFDGRLVFDHKRGILQLKVQPSQQATDTQRNAKTLSGGEKSFSQICLLLALWEAMGSPFRCLDEL
ncbi:hypothetical protein ABW19_dt0208721 [Dactylella cylindrospora]|nr:hypothetical protein ABW19_dt0208721 [Dactylella cylindrospora]